MKALLDTHTILWVGQSSEKLGPAAKEIVSDFGNELLVSAASAWEVATKVRIGKFPEARDLETHFMEVMSISGYTLLPITIADGLFAGRLTGRHKDPFDRMIAAQALALDIPVINIDPDLDSFGIRRIWE